MTTDFSNLDEKIRGAVQAFWSTRDAQAAKQGSASGVRDAGARSAVTGGAQMSGFVHLVRDFLHSNGVPQAAIRHSERMELPGWYRAEKKWDLLVVADGKLLAGIEFKSQVGPSFGNNFNNRTEEAIGSATDLWAAFREGAFKPSERPWLGYLMMLEESAASNRPVRCWEPYFQVFLEFKTASYVRRYELLLIKLVRDRLYDSACFLLSDRTNGPEHGTFKEPNPELTFNNFLTSLLGRAIAITKSS
ncbi:MAG: restriction endonuclease [Acidobacteria bacterium]|nr:restriction endonuclease [Acidobacteriota bacterium]